MLDARCHTLHEEQKMLNGGHADLMGSWMDRTALTRTAHTYETRATNRITSTSWCPTRNRPTTAQGLSCLDSRMPSIYR